MPNRSPRTAIATVSSTIHQVVSPWTLIITVIVAQFLPAGHTLEPLYAFKIMAFMSIGWVCGDGQTAAADPANGHECHDLERIQRFQRVARRQELRHDDGDDENWCFVSAWEPGANAGEFIRHSTAHVMAQAVQAEFPGTKLGIGPATWTS